MVEVFKSFVIWVPTIGIILAIWVAKKNGAFSRPSIQVSLFGSEDEKIAVRELVIGGPLANMNILVPITVRVSNHGSAPAKDIEIGLEGYSDVVVNYPELFISPSVSSAFKTVEAPAIRLAGNRFRRVFTLPLISPGKSIQLNNAGLPSNSLHEEKSFSKSRLSVTIHDPERKPKTKEYGIWFIDITNGDFIEQVKALAIDLRRSYHEKPLRTRIRMRLNNHRYGAELMFLEIKELREVNIEGEEESFFTIEKADISYGYRFLGGEIMHGSSGIH